MCKSCVTHLLTLHSSPDHNPQPHVHARYSKQPEDNLTDFSHPTTPSGSSFECRQYRRIPRLTLRFHRERQAKGQRSPGQEPSVLFVGGWVNPPLVPLNPQVCIDPRQIVKISQKYIADPPPLWFSHIDYCKSLITSSETGRARNTTSYNIQDANQI